MPDAKVYVRGNRIVVESEEYYGRREQVASHIKTTKVPGFTVPASPYFAERVAWAFRGLNVEFDEEYLKLWQTYQLFEEANAKREEPLEYRMETEPWPHQAICTSYGLRVPYAMFDVTVGGGKSKIVIDILENRRDIKLVLIIGTKKSSSVWEKEFAEHSWSGHEPVMLIPPMKMEDREQLLRQELAAPRYGPLVVVTNYTGLQPEFGPEHNRTFNGFAHLVTSMDWDMVVADESQNFKGWTSEISMQMDKLRDRSRYRYAMTGTMMPHGPLDVPGQFRFLDPGIFPSLGEFKDRYVQYGGYQNREILHYKDQEEFAQKVGRITISVPTEVLKLPDPIRNYVPIKLGPKARKLYDSLEEEMVAGLSSADVTLVNNTLTKRLRLQQITSGLLVTENLDTGEIKQNEVDTEKYEMLCGIIEDIPAHEPLVVFGKFRWDLDMVKKAAKATKRKYMELSGSKDDLAKWKAAKGGEILCVQVQAGGVGIDLTRAHIAIYVSITDSWGDFKQTEARINRPPQPYTCVFYYLVASNTVDVAIHGIVNSKKSVNEAIRDYLEAKYGKIRGPVL